MTQNQHTMLANEIQEMDEAITVVKADLKALREKRSDLIAKLLSVCLVGGDQEVLDFEDKEDDE